MKSTSKLPKVDSKYISASNRGQDVDRESMMSDNMYMGVNKGKGIERQYTWNQEGLLLNRRAQADHDMRVANILEDLEGGNLRKPTTMSQAKLNTTRLPKLDMQSQYSKGSYKNPANETYKKHEDFIMRELQR